MDIDFLLIQKMKRGDESAFDAFIRKYYEKILNFCVHHCPDTSYAEDLAQETFVHFFTNLSNYRYMGKTLNYLYTIAGNLCRDYFKKAKDHSLDEQELETHLDIKESETDEILERLAVTNALNTLPDEFREVVILYYFQDLKLTEIADVLGIGLPLVKYRMKQAKVKLEKLLKED